MSCIYCSIKEAYVLVNKYIILAFLPLFSVIQILPEDAIGDVTCLAKLASYAAKEKSSATYVPSVISFAVLKAMQYMQMPCCSNNLIAVNDKQKTFIDRYLTLERIDMLKAFSPEELRAWASRNITELNQILKNEGFDIRLQEEEDAFGVVAILKAAVKWKEKAEITEVTYNNTMYPAISLQYRKHDCRVTYVEGYAHPVVSVKTKSNDTVYFAIADEVLDGIELQDKVLSLLHAKKKREQRDHDSVIVPMVDLNVQNNIEWLLNLGFVNGRYISQAQQQTKFKMNEKGACAASGVAIAVKEFCGSSTPAYVIDKPFFAWIVRSGMQEPYFAAYISPNDWKKPTNESVSEE